MRLEYADPAIRERVENELLAGEDLLWVGQPQSPRRAMFGGSDRGSKATILAVVVGIQLMLVLGGAFFAMFASRTSTATTGATTTSSGGTPFIAIAVGVILVIALIAGFVPFAWSFRKARNTIYAITDRRVLIISGSSVQSYAERDIQFIERKTRKDGTGDITFRRERGAGAAYYGSGVFATRGYTTPIGFFGIADPHEVEALMLETFRPDAARKRKHNEDWDEEENYFFEGNEEQQAREQNR